MSELRKDTYITGNSDLPTFYAGVSRNCFTCGKWKATVGWKKNPTRGYMECPDCVAKRKANAKQSTK